MFRPRLIPILLVDGWSAYKTIQFKRRISIGDPINAVSIFNSFQVDEIVVLDISATNAGRTIDTNLVTDIASEAGMPFSVGGGIRTLEQISTMLSLGAEKVVLSTAIFESPRFISDAVRTFGSSSITACIDVGVDWFGRPVVYSRAGKNKLGLTPSEAARTAQDLGVGEIILQSIIHDGMMSGYDLNMLSEVSSLLHIPVVALGGAGTLKHMLDAYAGSEVSALASGSFFLFQVSNPSVQDRGVLISYPTPSDLDQFRYLRHSRNERV